MSSIIPSSTSDGPPKESAQQMEFRRGLDTILSWQERAQKIDDKIGEVTAMLGARGEKLLALHGDFDALTRDFWAAFARTLGCEDPTETVVRQQARQRSFTYISTLMVVIIVTVLAIVGWRGIPQMSVFAAVAGVATLCVIFIAPQRQIARARRVSTILSQEQTPFWLTSGRIALSNLGITLPSGAQWWWTGRVAFVFVRSLAARFSVDALECSLIWESSLSWSRLDKGITGETAALVLQRLVTANPRYRQLVDTFHTLSLLDGEYSFLEGLKTEVEQKVAEELRGAELLAEELRSTQARGRHQQKTPQNVPESRTTRPTPGAGTKASWDTLVIPQCLRETLRAYCRILGDYAAYQSAGVHLPKGLLFHGPPGCGKTQIAKTLSAQAGLNFIGLSTSDCKVGWIGHAAAKIAAVFSEARAKQPTLLFIDELDAVCPPRGAYHDCISQEVTAQLLEEVDGLLSDSQAIFLVGATNRPDQIDSAVLSRFAEKIEIPLPDETTRASLLELFLGSMRFVGKRERVILSLVQGSEGKSGRDLRAVVNQAVLSAVKRTSSPQDFALSEEDFTLPQTCPTSKATVAPGATGCKITTASTRDRCPAGGNR